MSNTEIVLFLDTNSLLHYPPIKDVDWKLACDTDSVRLILCLQVIRELDEKKDDSRLGNRASRTIKEIKSIRSNGGAVGDGVVLEVFNYEVRSGDFPATLSYESKDDRIVHAIKKYLEANPEVVVAVYTEDMGMNLRCEAHGVNVIEPDASTRLENPQSEQDKKYKLAITELNEHKNRVANLEIVISPPAARSPQRQKMEFSINPTVAERDLEEEFKDYQKSKRLYPMKHEDIAIARIVPSLTQQHNAIDKYNSRLEKHFERYREWLKNRYLLEQIRAHQITMSIWLVNSGMAPADDLDLTIEVGDPVALVYEASSKEAESLDLPKPPSPPDPPKQFYEDLVTGIRSRDFSLPNFERLMDRKASVEKEEETNTFRIKFDTKRLKHNEYEKVGDLILVLKPDTIRPFQVRYRITAANITRVIEGTIPIIVKSDDSEVK